MPEPWAISGRDLHLDLGRSGRREPLERALRDAVQSGRLAPGTLLPPSRALAGDLGIARNTVAEAYTQLVAEGWLTARQGSGTRVAEHPTPTVSPASHHGEFGISTRRVAGLDTAGASAPGRRAAYDLRAGFPDVAAFPHTEWLAAARTALSRSPASAFRYGDPQGVPELRDALAGYLARTRGVRVTPDRVVVCAGFGQGLWALASALHRLGARRIGVESHGLPLHRAILADAGLTVVGLPVGPRGAEPPGVAVEPPATSDGHNGPAARPLSGMSAGHNGPAAGSSSATSAGHNGPAARSSAGLALGPDAGSAHVLSGDLGAVLLTPAHQFPLGTALDAGRRAAFVRWARESGGVVIEDDYDGEFRYDRRPLGAMQALAPEEVVYGGTASKALAPAVGLAWLVPPAHLVAPVVAELTRAAARPAVLNQLTLAEFLTSGRYDRHVRRSRLAYRRRRDRLVAALTGLRVHGLPAGLHAVVELPAGRTEDEVVAAALQRGLAVGGLATFALDPGPVATPGAVSSPGADTAPGGQGPALVVGYATPPAHAFTTAVARLAAALRTP